MIKAPPLGGAFLARDGYAALTVARLWVPRICPWWVTLYLGPEHHRWHFNRSRSLPQLMLVEFPQECRSADFQGSGGLRQVPSVTAHGHADDIALNFPKLPQIAIGGMEHHAGVVLAAISLLS
jgi:hypothetical protein